MEFTLNSLNDIINPVVSTLGPYGSSVLLSNNGNPILTKDGLTVARVLGRSYEDNPIIVNYLKNLSEMEGLTGDGTTTMSVLVKIMYEEYLKQYSNLISFNKYKITRELDYYTEKILKAIEEQAISFSEDSKALYSFILTTLNQDTDIADLVYSRYSSLHKEGDLRFVQSDSYSYEEIQGVLISKEVLSILYCNTELSSEHEVRILPKFDSNLIKDYKDTQLLLVVNSELTELNMAVLRANTDCKVTVAYTPTALRKSISVASDYDSFKNKGSVKSIYSHPIGTFFRFTIENKSTIEAFRKEYDKAYTHHIFSIGESDELLYKETIMRIEDCTKAIQKAEGKVVVGGGYTYYKVSEEIQEYTSDFEKSLALNILCKALQYPYLLFSSKYGITPKRIAENAVYDSLATSMAVFKYAVETLKGLVLTDYIVLDE